ncbi:reverse transcriptase [Phytophthora megakarya]|uniref:Reverse transcriptase n=1 Tax=Phytophthora megakarya TaxID=4795 RepID=A0A225W6M8_9STRA|nr:reverse transcriptase [Phytophthora megakarya]
MLDLSARVVYQHPHPLLSRLVCLWVGKRRWTQKRAHFKRAIAKASKQRCFTAKAERENNWRVTGGSIGAIISGLEWKRLRRILGLNARGEQLLFRNRHGALSTWNPITQVPGWALLKQSSVFLKAVFYKMK